MTYAYLMLQLGTYVCGARMNYFFSQITVFTYLVLQLGRSMFFNFSRWISDAEFL